MKKRQYVKACKLPNPQFQQVVMACRIAKQRANLEAEMKNVEDLNNRRREEYAKQMEAIRNQQNQLARESETKNAEHYNSISALLACALGDPESGPETQAEQVHHKFLTEISMVDNFIQRPICGWDLPPMITDHDQWP